MDEYFIMEGVWKRFRGILGVVGLMLEVLVVYGYVLVSNINQVSPITSPGNPRAVIRLTPCCDKTDPLL